MPLPSSPAAQCLRRPWALRLAGDTQPAQPATAWGLGQAPGLLGSKAFGAFACTPGIIRSFRHRLVCQRADRMQFEV